MTLIRWPRVRAFLRCSFREGFEDYPNILAICKNERAEYEFIHVMKFEWIFSGVHQTDRGQSDLGFTRTYEPCTRAKALGFFRKLHPRGTIIHIDDRNKIITFKVTG